MGAGATTGDHRVLCGQTKIKRWPQAIAQPPLAGGKLFDALMGRIAGRFARVEPRRRARSLVLGLLSDLPRKNCWTIAEHAGHATPDGLQHLLARAKNP